MTVPCSIRPVLRRCRWCLANTLWVEEAHGCHTNMAQRAMAHPRTYVHTYMRTYIHTYIRTYIHAYVRTCMHIHTTYVHAQGLEGISSSAGTTFVPCLCDNAAGVDGAGYFLYGTLAYYLFTQHSWGYIAAKVISQGKCHLICRRLTVEPQQWRT